MNYSVLMSVYARETASNLRESLSSVFSQTVPSNDVVLVCDGPVGADLDAVIDSFAKDHPELNVIRLERNVGLGNALNTGLSHCKNDIVARSDSDDINVSTRMEKQLPEFDMDPELVIISSDIAEFEKNPTNFTGQRTVPHTHKEIIKYSRKRNPFNHPAATFRKSAIEAAGGYNQDYPYFEDYSLWIRLLRDVKGKAKNIDEQLVLMRVNRSTYLRRGGIYYTKDMLRFHRDLRESGWSTWFDFLTGAIPHAAVCVLPGKVRGWIYKILH